MPNVKAYEMEDITYKEWSDHLDLVASSRAGPWLPAYGYQAPSPLQGVFHIQEDPFCTESASLLGQQQYFLETIVEETSDDLCSESDKSGPTGWNSDSDADSVIHVPKMPGIRTEWRPTESDAEIPKKRRRRLYERPSLSDEDEPQEVSENASLSSRSSSLVTFESLEKHCEDVFKTTASSDPFGHDVYSDANRWKPSRSPDSLEEAPEGFSSDEDNSCLSDDTLHHSLSSHSSFRSSLTNDSRLRSYRSFDSLNLFDNTFPIRYSVSELSQSHSALDYEKEKEREQEFVVRDKKLTATTADLSTVTDSYVTELYSKNMRKRQEASYHDKDQRRRSYEEKTDSKFTFRERKSYSVEGLKSQLPMVPEDSSGKSEPCLSVPSKTQHSVENLSEDSGFGDHKVNIPDIRNSVSSIPEDEDSSQPESSSSSYYSDCSGSDEGSVVSSETCCVNKMDVGLKLTQVDAPEVRGCPTEKNDDVGVNFSSSRSETHAEGEASTTSSVSFASPNGDDIRRRPASTKSCDDLKSTCYFGGKLSVFEQCDQLFYEPREDSNGMAARLPVVSTPNLFVDDEDFLRTVPSASSSLTHVPLKSLDDDDGVLRNGTKGVHFCPVVSEVSWRDSYSEDDSSSSDASSDPSTDEMSNRSLEDLCLDNEDEDFDDDDEISGGGATLNINVNNPTNGEKPHVEEKRVTPTTSATPTCTSHVSESEATQAGKLSVSVASSSDTDDGASSMASTGKPAKTRFGGFFQRFSFRRLSSRVTSAGTGKKHKESKEERKEKGVSVGVGTKSVDVEDVRIIPLHGPEEERTRTVAAPPVVSAKPPLPPNPPRMSGASRRRSPNCGIVSSGSQDVEANGNNGNRGNSNMPGVGNFISTDIDCGKDVITRSSSNVEPRFITCEFQTGLLETDLDTDITVQCAVRRPLVQNNVGTNKKARSLMNLGLGEMSVHQPQRQDTPSNLLQPSRGHGSVAVDDRAKSMEFLLDKENQAAVLPPENELQKGGAGERVMSEHQLRVQRSLQKLNIPEWYKNSAVAQTPQGFLLKRNSDVGREHTGWPGLGSKTTSLSSLGSTQSASARSPTSHVLSPTPHLLTRWSTSRLNSGATSTSTSPCGSARSSFNYRQPYLGWRSQERLTRPRTPAERLAAGLLPQQKQHLNIFQNQNQAPPNLSEVRTSIKEVTSAIVHYVSGVQENGSRETLRAHPSPKWTPSPRGSSGRLCWLESSFVGSRPLDQPETPLTLTETAPVKSEAKSNELYLELKPRVGGAQLDSGDIPVSHEYHEERFEKAFDMRTKPSPGSTTLDDVLESLLGLPPTSRSPSPAAGSSPGRCRPMLALPDRQHQRHSCGDIRANASGSASDGSKESRVRDPTTGRRKSEGSTEVVATTAKSSVVQVQGTPADAVVKCRYSKCGKTATLLEAKRTFKTCHNCAHAYCSRECRRAHWERHRRTCLHSRVGALCRQVLAAAKDDAATLHQLSLLARRGYLTHGRGAVKTFFSSPELAEKFVTRGFSELGEPAYVRWSDLLPTEMGTDLYAELCKLCKSYNPESRFVLYVAVCVVSEVPTTGAVKWERQLVSRCCKIRLDKSLVPPKPEKGNTSQPPPRRSSSECVNITRDMENPETLILTSLPGIEGQISQQKVREISFTNIQRELRQRGVSLRRQFPDVYKKLCAYVEGTSERFTPVTIYPRDAASGKCFMCIIMPDAEPEKLELVPKDSSRVQTVDISVDHDAPA